MSRVFSKSKRTTMEDKCKKRDLMIKPFIRKYKQPVLVHAVNNSASFSKILRQGLLKLPKNHRGDKKCLFMEKILGIDNSIFLSLGFVYLSHYDFKYNLIFDLDLLKEATYYKRPLIVKCYNAIVNYWYDNDKDYLNKVRGSSPLLNEVIGFYVANKDSRANSRGLAFWRIEKELYKMIMKYPKRNELFKIVKRLEPELRVKFPYSKRSAKNSYSGFKFPEIIVERDINLLENPSFLGFYVEGGASGEIKRLIDRYKGKILFNGSKIEVIK